MMENADQHEARSSSAHRCPECGGDDIVCNIHVTLTAEVGSVGLNYKAMKFFHNTEPLLADLCRACGTICRFHVAGTDRNWITS